MNKTSEILISIGGSATSVGLNISDFSDIATSGAALLTIGFTIFRAVIDWKKHKQNGDKTDQKEK